MRKSLALVVLAAAGFFGGLPSPSAQAVKDVTTGCAAASPRPSHTTNPPRDFPINSSSAACASTSWNGTGRDRAAGGTWNPSSEVTTKNSS